MAAGSEPTDRACVIHHTLQKLQVLQSKRLRIGADAPLCVGNRQIHEELGIPFSADHIKALAGIFDSKLADAGNPLVRELGRHLCRPRADLSPRGNEIELTCSRPAQAVPQKTAELIFFAPKFLNLGEGKESMGALRWVCSAKRAGAEPFSIKSKFN
jgi:hypothetical protein